MSIGETGKRSIAWVSVSVGTSSSSRVTTSSQGSAEHSDSCPQPSKFSCSWSCSVGCSHAHGCRSHPLAQREGTATSAQQLRKQLVQRIGTMCSSLRPTPKGVNEKPTGCDAVTCVSAKGSGNRVCATHNLLTAMNPRPKENWRRPAVGRTVAGRGPASLPARHRRPGSR